MLRVCADPNKLPFSNDRGEGFENRIAALVAAELGWSVHYTWHAERRGFIRNTLRAERCDVIMGVPAGYELVTTTRPYYTSSYVFVQPAGKGPPFRSLDDPRLRSARVGVQVIGDDMANSPPLHALTSRGVVENLVGFSVFGDYASDSPQRPIIDALARAELDVAVAWGPLAGYYAARSPKPLRITPVQADAAWPMTFAIAAGVRRGDEALKARLESVLERRAADVSRILRDFSVPLVGT